MMDVWEPVGRCMVELRQVTAQPLSKGILLVNRNKGQRGNNFRDKLIE